MLKTSPILFNLLRICIEKEKNHLVNYNNSLYFKNICTCVLVLINYQSII